jgi:hypothetical protein
MPIFYFLNVNKLYFTFIIDQLIQESINAKSTQKLSLNSVQVQHLIGKNPQKVYQHLQNPQPIKSLSIILNPQHPTHKKSKHKIFP